MFSKTGISLSNINFAERNSEAAMAGGGGGENIFFWLQRSTIRVHRSSVGSSVAHKGKA